MASTAWDRCGMGALPLGLTLAVAPGRAETGGVFEALAGSWSGAGAVNLVTGQSERLRCRAVYQPAGATRLHLDLRCASDSFTMQVASDISRQGNAISGTWSEATLGVAGEVSGSVNGDTIRAVVQGAGMSARLSLALRGDTQSVVLNSQGFEATSATVTLRRG